MSSEVVKCLYDFLLSIIRLLSWWGLTKKLIKIIYFKLTSFKGNERNKTMNSTEQIKISGWKKSRYPYIEDVTSFRRYGANLCRNDYEALIWKRKIRKSWCRWRRLFYSAERKTIIFHFWKSASRDIRSCSSRRESLARCFRGNEHHLKERSEWVLKSSINLPSILSVTMMNFDPLRPLKLNNWRRTRVIFCAFGLLPTIWNK